MVADVVYCRRSKDVLDIRTINSLEVLTECIFASGIAEMMRPAIPHLLRPADNENPIPATRTTGRQRT